MFGEVISTERLTPQLIRVVLGGDGLEGFASSGQADEYINCAFPDAEQGSFNRRMTVRAWDEGRRELTLDIAHHGDVGYAGRWAQHARAGDQLTFKGPGGGYTPPDEADCYLFVGDESALPALAVCAERVPTGRPVVVVAEVEDAAGEIALSSPGELDVRWVHRAGTTASPQLLADAVAALSLPDGRLSAFVHGEADSTRAVRRTLLGSGLVVSDDLSCSPYWHRGDTDEEWRAIKGRWVREMNAETFRE